MNRSRQEQQSANLNRDGSPVTAIAVIGSLNMDLVVRTPHLPVPGETIIRHGFTTVPGGKVANQAVAAARLGARVVIAGRVGAQPSLPTCLELNRFLGLA